jgi:hypothetical protein
MKVFNCKLCDFQFSNGVVVCQGCQGDVVYGATEHERDEAMKYWGFGTAGLVAMVLYGLPMLIASNFAIALPAGLGLGFYALGIMAIAGIAGAVYGLRRTDDKYSRHVRTFRRSSIRR